MLERIKGTLVLLPLGIAFVCGDLVVSIVTIILSVLAFLELHTAFKNKGIFVQLFPPLILTVTLIFNLVIPIDHLITSIATTLLLLVAALAILRRNNIVDIAVTTFSILYAFYPFYCMSNLFSLNVNIVALIFITSFATDVFAYLTGKFVGKHKLIPDVSPNKTIEGSVGGVVGAMLFGCMFIYFVHLPIHFIAFVFIGSIVAQFGDLFASSIKRYCQIKDFGKLIPGHGGVLDRFDSVIFVTLLATLFI